MTVEIHCGDTAALPAAERAAELLTNCGEILSLACADAASAYSVLRTVMNHSYTHAQPALVRLICANETVCRAYRFQWNMWYAERKPEK